MWRCIIPTLAAFLCIFVGGISVTAQSKQSPTQLQANSSIERTLEPHGVHTYIISLTEGQYVNFTVIQRGVDVIVRVFAPTGKSLGAFDTPNGGDGPENGTFTAVSAGDYRIVISPLDPSGGVKQGKYEIKIVELRDATEQELKVGRDEEKRKAKGLELLKELVDSLPEIRQPQTRMRMKMECADLLWDVDQKKAAKLLSEVVGESQAYVEVMKGETADYEEAWQWASQFRYEAIQTLAAHDPEAALSLLRNTSKTEVSSIHPGPGHQETEFEMTLVSQIAKKNPKHAYEAAQESLKKNYSMSLTQTLKHLAESDKDLASELAKSIVDKLTSEDLAKRPDGLQLAMTLLHGSQSTPDSSSDQKQLLTNELRRRLLQKALDEVKSTPISGDVFSSMEGSQVLNLISQMKSLGPVADAIIPGTTAILDKKMEELAAKNERLKEWTRYSVEPTSTSDNVTLTEMIEEVPDYARFAVAQRIAEQAAMEGDVSKARQLIEQISPDPRIRKRFLDQLEYQAAISEASKGQMESALARAANLTSIRERSMILSEIAGRIGPGYKRATAIAMLDQARSLTGPDLYSSDQYQMMARLQIATVFARYEAKRGFEMLDPIVDQFNELTEAAKKLDGFGTTFFVGGELSTQNGNGLQAIAKPLTTSIGSLSIVDFDRAKAVADRIGLPEVKLMSYMAVAQQAINPTAIYSPSAAYLNILNR